MGYFQVRYNSRVINYDRRGFIRLTTAVGEPNKSLIRGSGDYEEKTLCCQLNLNLKNCIEPFHVDPDLKVWEHELVDRTLDHQHHDEAEREEGWKQMVDHLPGDRLG